MITKLILSIYAAFNGFLQSIVNATWFEWFFLAIGGAIGWLIGRFEPAFPLLAVAFMFVLYDAWSAYELDKRVHKVYPDKVKREQAKFVSYKFRSVIPTLIERMVIIILAYACERWVFVHVTVPVSYIAAAVVCAEQALSIAENKASCRLPGDRHARIWKMLAKVLIDKTERHFDLDLGEEAHKMSGIDDYINNGNIVATIPNDSSSRKEPAEIEPYNEHLD